MTLFFVLIPTLISTVLNGVGRNLGSSVKSTYKHLCRYEYGSICKRVWKVKLPLKIQIFFFCG